MSRKWSAEVPQNMLYPRGLFSHIRRILEKKVLRCSLREHLRAYVLEVVNNPESIRDPAANRSRGPYEDSYF